jgi:hypothetical protein
MVRSYGLSNPAHADHRTCSSSANDLVLSPLQCLGKNRPPPSSRAAGMARASSKTMALPRRLPLGRQRQGLHFPSRRAKKGRCADAGISNEITTASQAEGDCLNISTLAKLELAAIFSHLGCATREPLALGIRPVSSSLPLPTGIDRILRNCAKWDCKASLSMSRWCMLHKREKTNSATPRAPASRRKWRSRA